MTVIVFNWHFCSKILQNYIIQQGYNLKFGEFTNCSNCCVKLFSMSELSRLSRAECSITTFLTLYLTWIHYSARLKLFCFFSKFSILFLNQLKSFILITCYVVFPVFFASRRLQKECRLAQLKHCDLKCDLAKHVQKPR